MWKMVQYAIQLCIGTVLIFSSVESQTVHLNEPEKQPPPLKCAEGLAAGEEYYFVKGQADLSTATDPTSWDNLIILIEIKPVDGKSFSSIDRLDITKGCNGYQADRVYCESNTSVVYNFVFNDTANMLMSRATIRAIWTGSTLSSVLSNNRTLPDMNPAVQPNDIVICDGVTTQLISQPKFSYATICTNVEFCVDASPSSSYNVIFSINDIEMKRSNNRCISNNNWCANGNLRIAFEYERDNGCVRKKLYTGLILADGPFQFPVFVIMVVVSSVCGAIIILLSWTYEKWIVCLPFCGGENKNVTTEPEGGVDADSPVEINRLPPLNSPPPASANGTKPKPTATTTSDEDRTKKKRKKNKVTGGESEKKNTEEETPEKETPEERKTPEKKQRKTKKAGESDEGAEQTDQVRPLPSPRMVGEPGFNTSSTSPVNLRSNFSASLAHQGIKSDTRPPSIEVTTRALPKPKKK